MKKMKKNQDHLQAILEFWVDLLLYTIVKEVKFAICIGMKSLTF